MKLARSAVVDVMCVCVRDLIITHTFPPPLHPHRFPTSSLHPDLLLPHAGTKAHFLLVSVVLEKEDVERGLAEGREDCHAGF